jgi:hypothetical protein
LTISIDEHGTPATLIDSVYPSDKSCSLICLVAYADRFSLAGKTFVADINVIVARCQIIAGELAQSDVEIAGCVGKECTITIGYVIVAGCVAKEGLNTNSRIAVTGCAAKERLSTSGRVVGTGCVAIERLTTGGRVIVAACIAKKRLKTLRGVAVAAVPFIGIRWSRWACRTCCSSRAGWSCDPLITLVALRPRGTSISLRSLRSCCTSCAGVSLRSLRTSRAGRTFCSGYTLCASSTGCTLRSSWASRSPRTGGTSGASVFFGVRGRRKRQADTREKRKRDEKEAASKKRPAYRISYK